MQVINSRGRVLLTVKSAIRASDGRTMYQYSGDGCGGNVYLDGLNAAIETIKLDATSARVVGALPEPDDYTEIIRAYEAQGYVRPAGASYALIAERRAASEIDPLMVPLVSAGGATAWGIPFVNGEPLRVACPLP